MKYTKSLPAAQAGAPENDPREMMLRLPAILQPLLTALTGKAPRKGEAWRRWTPAERMWTTLVWFFAAVALGAWAAHTGGAALLLLPPAWLLVVSNTRIIQTGLVHEASHGMLLTNKIANEIAGEALSLLIWIQTLAQYRQDHGPHHQETAQESDMDLSFLVQVGGLRPGLTMKEYWRHFWLTLFSPRFHGEFLLARLAANFVKAESVRKVASFGFAAVLFGLAAAGFGRELVLAYLVPVTVLTQMSAWAGVLGLHQWVPVGGNKAARVASLTSGRFIGESVPASELKGADAVFAWAGWTARMLFIHLPLRLAIVPGDLPSHDWHHFHPVSREWANAAYARRDEVLSGSARARLYTEIWGAGAAIEATFARLAALEPDAVLGQPLTYRQRQSVMLGM
jgi:fatty acid desaturase